MFPCSIRSVRMWLDLLREAKKTCLVQDGVQKVHYLFADGSEMIEEYNVKNKQLVLRQLRKKSQLKGTEAWEVEVGKPQLKKPDDLEPYGIRESRNEPYVFRCDACDSFEWHIRNLPYPVHMYSVQAEPEHNCITVRTSNKKYFKRIVIPDLERVGLHPEQQCITYSHKLSTLVIKYKKPAEVIQMEKKVQDELGKLKASRDGDVDCNPS